MISPACVALSLMAVWTGTPIAADPECFGPVEVCGYSSGCEQGYYCTDGVKLPCAAGRFGSSAKETSFLCSGPCPAGSFCPEGSSSPIPCGNNTVYCPAGSSMPSAVSTGNYTFGGTSAAGRTAEELCPKGRYCQEGVAVLCPAGTFGDREGLQDAACSGPCPAGWFCPPGTVNPYSLACEGAEHYCPEGSGRLLSVARGYYADGVAVDLVGGTGGYSSQTRCPIGRYCVGGGSFPCPAGRFGASQMSIDLSCSGACSEGHFCPEGSHRADQHVCGNASVFCPEASSSPTAVSEGFFTVQGGESDTDRHPWLGVAETRTAQVQCEPGHYCVDGVRFPCPPGYFGSSPGLSTPSCSGLCAEGYLCGEGATTPTEAVCGGEGDLFCPAGSSSPSKVGEGHYTLGAEAAASDQVWSTRTAERLCEPGFWCEGGFRYPCEAGSFGGEFGATHGSCSGACPAGFICGSGSISAEERPCGDPSLFCPGGNWEPVEVSVGYYSVGGGGPTTRTGQELSPPGSYADQGLLFVCPAGTYGATHGLSLSQCSGGCAPGFYCPTGSISPRQRACGGASFVCPAGSGWPIAVDDGYYTTDYSTIPDAEECPPGLFRNVSYPYDTDPTRGEVSAVATAIPLAPCQPCPDGTFKAITGDSLALCIPCDEHTAESIEARTSCVCRRFAGGDVSASVLYFNTTTATCQNVTTNFRPSAAEVALAESTFTRYSQKECEPGHFCVQGVRFPCPGGRFGASARETRSACQGECARGWYCPESSISANQIPCGAAHLFCPAGSSAPGFVDAGYYSYSSVISDTPTTAAAALSAFSNITYARAIVAAGYRPDDDRGAAFRSGVALCPAGWYCTGDGAGSECPPGSYGSEPGLSDSTCSGVCAAGFYCGAGAITPTESVCGGSGLYCPVGSSTPSTVLVGYYGAHAGVEAGLQAARDLLNETHSAQVLCEPGYFCENGRKEPCPPGTFLGRYGENSRESCAPCKAGYYCPGESTTVATAVACGSPTVFCPAGSTTPFPVTAGHYSVGGGSGGTTRSSQVRCEAGYYCRDAVRKPCPAGTYGASTGLRDQGCSGMCPAGMACAEGTVHPMPCEDGSYAIGGAVVCNACPGKRVAGVEGEQCRTSRSCCT